MSVAIKDPSPFLNESSSGKIAEDSLSDEFCSRWSPLSHPFFLSEGPAEEAGDDVLPAVVVVGGRLMPESGDLLVDRELRLSCVIPP